MCDFSAGFRLPEMVKRRPVVVLSPKIRARPGLCTVVALSTSPPDPVMSYHCQVDFDPPLPGWMTSEGVWVKGDMVATVGFHRLDFISLGKSKSGKRRYYYSTLSAQNLTRIRACVLHGIGLSSLTKHL
ncbi:MAG TPA: type II toxin-antitoxin system PemK/MazF family toxin [Phenylobacterium sp.]|nr:type II toxin-antitoxin system PemK/MazF family toxin [Phenylobacterium sp.]